MKSALFAAALAVTISIPALAHSMQPPAGSTMPSDSMPAGSGTMPSDPAMQPPADPAMGSTSTMPQGSAPMTPPPADPAMGAAPADSTMPQSGTMPSDPAAPGAMAPGGSMPSDMAAPSGSTPGAMPMAGAPAAGDPSTYPVCSRTVTDRCVNRDAAPKGRKRR